MWVSVIAVLHLSAANYQLEGFIDSNALADSAFDTDNDGAVDSKFVASDPLEASNLALAVNADAPDTDDSNPVIPTNLDDAIAFCGADNSQADSTLHTRDEGACSVNRGPPSEASPPKSQSNGLSLEEFWNFLRGKGRQTEQPDTQRKIGPFVKNRLEKARCLPPFDTDVCCGGPPGIWISVYGVRVLEKIDDCEISTS